MTKSMGDRRSPGRLTDVAGIEDLNMATLLLWFGAPATFVWAVLTLRAPPTALRGIAKLVIGAFIFILAMQEEPSGTHPFRFVVAGHASLAASSALLGLVDLIGIKLNAMHGMTDKKETSI